MENIFTFAHNSLNTKLRILLFCIIILSCKRENRIAANFETINLIDAYESKKEALLSHVAEKVDYIPLESNENCLLAEPYVIASVDSLIVITSFRKIFVFNKKTGKFKYEISSYGRGPSEYLGVVPNGYDELNNLTYVQSSENIKGYFLDGTLIKRFKLPQPNFEVGKENFITNFWPFLADTYIGYSYNASGNNPVKLQRFDSTGRILYNYPNYNFFDGKRDNNASIDGNQGWFFSFRDSIRFFEQYTDTIFTIMDTKLIPRYFLSMGKYSLSYFYKRIEPVFQNEQLEHFNIRNIRESSCFLFFTAGIDLFRYLCFYDKKQKVTTVCDIFEGKELNKYSSHYETKIIGLQNDIDDFVPVGVGRGGLYINQNDELITYIQADELAKWFNMNPEKAKNLPAKLKEFSNIRVTDNIIVIIVKLKN
jgi:hypothetical protein